jgi:hypothetical protein
VWRGDYLFGGQKKTENENSQGRKKQKRQTQLWQLKVIHIEPT